MKRAALLVFIVSCNGDADSDAVRLQATIIRAHPDTVRFSAPAVARACAGGRATLLEGASLQGPGVLVLLRHGDSLTAGAYPLTALGDSTTIPGAHVAARYILGDVPHGFALDSGTIDLEGNAAEGWDARVRGRGLEGTVRLGLEATFTGVPAAPAGDSVACAFQ